MLGLWIHCLPETQQNPLSQLVFCIFVDCLLKLTFSNETKIRNLRAVKLVSRDIIHPGGWQGLESSESTQVEDEMACIFNAWFLMVWRIILSGCMHTHTHLEVSLRTIRDNRLELALSSEKAFTPVKSEYNVDVKCYHITQFTSNLHRCERRSITDLAGTYASVCVCVNNCAV